MKIVGPSKETAFRPDMPWPSTLVDYTPACVWPARPVRRIAVLTNAEPAVQLPAALDQLTVGNRWVRWVQRRESTDPEQQRARQAFDELAPWWEWADVVITDADHRSIAECVRNGRVPAVALPSSRFPVDARRSLQVVQPWSARGLALHLSLGQPSLGLLHSAAGMRTRRRPGLRLECRTA